MRKKSFLYRLRAGVAALFDLSSEEIATGEWWEIDLIIVVLAGSFAAGILAWATL